MGTIRRFAQNFSSLHETVARNVAILLKMAVQCCAVLADELRSSPFGDSVKQQRIGELKNKVKGAMLYAGMIQYKVSLDVVYLLLRRLTESSCQHRCTSSLRLGMRRCKGKRVTLGNRCSGGKGRRDVKGDSF